MAESLVDVPKCLGDYVEVQFQHRIQSFLLSSTWFQMLFIGIICNNCVLYYYNFQKLVIKRLLTLCDYIVILLL